MIIAGNNSARSLVVLLCRVATVALVFGGAARANAQDWPTRPVRVVSPFAAGSASDTVSRVVLEEVSRLLGQPMVIEPRPGGGGTLGFTSVARADPDGYTLVTSSSSMATESVLHRKLAYDPIKDFVHVVLIGTSPNVLVASRQRGFNTVAELVAAAKAQPGTVTFASAGIGSSSHMAAERFRLAANIDVRHIPFREGGLTEVMAGRIDFYFLPLAAAGSVLHNDKVSSACGQFGQSGSGAAASALDRRSRISERSFSLLERDIGASQNPSGHRAKAARRYRESTARSGDP